MLNGHGDDLHLVGGQIRHNFSSNVYYKGCPQELLSALPSAIRHIQNYPSPIAEELNDYAAEKHTLPANHFLFTNGATEAFYLIAQAFRHQQAQIVGPTFAEYEDACKSHQLHYQIISKKEINQLKAGLVFICNPNNPDGTILRVEKLASLFRRYPQTVFVIDEAYIEFTAASSPVIQLITQYDNLVVVRSLTKTFAIPGLRLGYIVSNPSLIQHLLQFKMPWTVNKVAIAAGIEIFKNYQDWQFDIETLLQETQHFQQAVGSIPWLTPHKSYTTYFLAELHQGTAKALKAYLAEQHQILVRDATNFNGLTGEYIRLAVQSPQANQCLIQALNSWNFH